MYDGSIAIRDVEVRFWGGLVPPPDSTDTVIHLHKPRDFVRRLQAAIERTNPRRMMEIGIQEGGSAIYWQHILGLDVFIGVDQLPSIPHLTRYLDRHGLGESVRLHLGVSQDDAPTMRSILEAEIGEAALDVVIDDASHMHAETRATLEIVLPFVRPGGAYIIEDWAWGHVKDWPVEVWADVPLMSPILFEAALVSAYAPGVIRQVDIEKSFVVLWRGDAELPRDGSFKLTDNYLPRGLRFDGRDQ